MPQRSRSTRKSRKTTAARKTVTRARKPRATAQRSVADLKAVVDAINRSQAVIEFSIDGTIQYANESFLKAVGFTLDELRGQHHSLFVDPSERGTPDYHEFWARLVRGEFHSGQFRRIGRDGHEVWIQATYNPVLDAHGKVLKVVKFATEITAQVRNTQQMSQTVAEAGELARAAAVGDLTKRLSVEGKTGPMEELSRGVNALLDTMSALVGRVKTAADEVARGADEISQGNMNLSQRTEQQASSLQETASSMEEMTSTVRQNADNASEANQLALAAREQAERGGTVVARAVRSMTEINESSRRIADIIGVIDDIAFQTNLLALNAAVEAARAGDQGRGFAVVATEVRNLAGRSASAAKEIKALIQDSVRRVEEGSGLVTQSGTTLEQIVVAVKKVTDIVGEISAASQEQSAGIEQVSKAVVQLDQLTQQNAALVEQASAASQSMAEHARDLNETLRGYQVCDEFIVAATLQQQPFARTPPRTISAPAARSERRATERPWSQRASTAGNTAENIWEEF